MPLYRFASFPPRLNLSVDRRELEVLVDRIHGDIGQNQIPRHSAARSCPTGKFTMRGCLRQCQHSMDHASVFRERAWLLHLDEAEWAEAMRRRAGRAPSRCCGTSTRRPAPPAGIHRVESCRCKTNEHLSPGDFAVTRLDRTRMRPREHDMLPSAQATKSHHCVPGIRLRSGNTHRVFC